jgi:pimeloyl-ACP methyl ester carboxylesterase
MTSEPKGQYRTVSGLRIRCADSGGSASQHLVLTSPWSESLQGFGPMWTRWSGIARLLAIDLPGFGRSEWRADLVSPVAMSEFLIQILDEWNIRDPHLVCPDVGIPAALLTAARHPGRIRSLVIGGGRTACPLEAGGAMTEPTEADLGAFMREDLRAPAHRLPPLAGLLPRIFTPVQIITGGLDPVVPAATAGFLHAWLPNSRLDVLDTRHLAWEDASAEYCTIVAAWVSGGYLTGSAGMSLM